MNIKTLFRIAARHILGFLTKIVLKKHRPTIILITSENNPTIIREALYGIISAKYNSRRNIEKTESEFSIPLTVFGELYYPKGYLDWAKVVLKTATQIIYLKPYKHTLIIQINKITPDIFKFWKKILSCSASTNYYEVDTNKIPPIEIMAFIDQRSGKKKVLFVPKSLEPLFRNLKISNEEAVAFLKDGFLPSTRIGVIPARNKSYIVDARYYYYPSNIKSVFEIAESLGKNKYIVTNIKSDLENLPGDYKVLSDHDLKNIPNTPDSVFIFRGSRDKYLEEIRKISLVDLEI